MLSHYRFLEPRQTCGIRIFETCGGISRLSVKISALRAFSSFTSSATSSNKSDQSSSNTNINTKSFVSQLPPTFYVPRSERSSIHGKGRQIFDIDYVVGETRLTRNSRTCPTRELYFLNAQWNRHKSPYRKFRHMASLFQSAPFQRLLFPDLFCLSVVATGVTYYNEVLVHITAAGAALGPLSMSPTTFAGATTAIGLLAGFRLNGSYARYREGRQIWSDTQTGVRELARQTLMYIDASNDGEIGNDNYKIQHRTRLLRLCQAFPVTFLFHLNDKGSHHNMKRHSPPGEPSFQERVAAEFCAELKDVYFQNNEDQSQTKSTSTSSSKIDMTQTLLNEDFERLCRVKSKGGNVPLEVITCMSESIAVLSKDGSLHPVYVRELDDKVHRLMKALGGGEKVLKTPLPTGFSRHASRLLFLWSNSLPFALYPLLGPLGTLPATLLTSYAVLGIEDISVQLEEPFDILPLRQFSDTMFDGIRAMENNYNRLDHSK